MIRIILPLICAALGFEAASCSQSEGPLAPAAEAPAPPPQPTHGAASAATTPADSAQANAADQPASGTDQAASSSPQPPDTPADQAPSSGAASTTSAGTPTERRASTLIGMAVVAADGSSLGDVKDIIFDRQGRATHLVIAYGTEPQSNPSSLPNDGEAVPSPDGKLTAMPWDAAMASIRGGQLVLDSAQLQAAPGFTAAAWPNLDDPAWSAAADAYWRKAVQAAIEAHPGAPVDSTSRQRARPDRDGE
jgi:sporulation protein YlmC with PRC-barrel domain